MFFTSISKNSSDESENVSVNALLGSSNLKWAIIRLFPSYIQWTNFNPVQSKCWRWLRKGSLSACGRAIVLQPSSMKSWVLLSCCMHTYCLLSLPHDRYWVGIVLYIMLLFECEKINNSDHLPIPTYPSLSVWLALIALSPHYSTCMSYNLFIFCQICLKFLHKFFTHCNTHTDCFILSIKKKNWKFDDYG